VTGTPTTNFTGPPRWVPPLSLWCIAAHFE
jgi:hypothetical protein